MDRSHLQNRDTISAEADDDVLAGFVSKEHLASEFSVSSRTIERWVRLRILPPPVRLGRTALYHVDTVREHLLDLQTRGGRRR